jgi:two-component system, chemotaxis family, sensor kinase Cph1
LSPLDGQPLDLSDCAFRSVSPVHLEYMRNMQTAASMSISILVDGELWGLVSCHHATPRVLGPLLRSGCDFIGQLLAMQIGARERGAHADERLALKDVEAELLARVSWSSTVQSGLSENPEAWLALAHATGAAIVKDGTVTTAGLTPDEPQLLALAAWLRTQGADEVFATDSLGELFPAARAHADRACGVLAVPISALHPHYILWFRPELVHTVRWGGAPAKMQAPDGSLHPRRSFAQWAEEVRGRAEPWTRAETEAAAAFRHSVVNFVLRRAEERAQLTEKLETTNRELEAFSYSVSHDLRAPFRHVVGYAQLLRERGEQLDERSLHYLDSIIASALSAGQLVDDLLNFSQLGRAALDLTRVDVDKMVFELQRSMEMEAAGRPIKWVVHRLPPAVADAALLRQALANLLDNAVKYTRGREPAVIEISGEERGHEVVYAVRDNGVGFDMAYVGKLFGVFQRLHRAEEFEGTGIGLALVRRIVDRHGGWIAAEGELDQGAVFRIGLPKPVKEPAQ